MKIRSSFVSNSSSSSFVLGKHFMTEEQIEEFREWIGKYKMETAADNYIRMHGQYFMTKEQIEAFREWISRRVVITSGDTYVIEHEYYFRGNVNFIQYAEVQDKLDKLGINREHYVL